MILIFVSVGNQMACVNLMSIYATTIFEDCAKGDGPVYFSPKACTYITGFSHFLGAIISIYTVKRYTRR